MCQQADIEVTIKISSTSLSADEMEACLQWKATWKVEEPESVVIYECSFDKEKLLEEHIENACKELESRAAVIRKLPVDCEFVIWCVIHSKSNFVGSYLDVLLINRLSRLKTSVALSYYDRDGSAE